MNKYILRQLYKVNKIIWKITKPTTIGVRLILIKEDKILLVKHTYQDSWYLPGGGVKKGEIFEQAARREFKEELGGELNELKLFGVYNNFYESKNDSIVVLLCTDFTFTGKTDNEIEKFDYFQLDNLPEGVSPGTRKRINEYLNNLYPAVGRW